MLYFGKKEDETDMDIIKNTPITSMKDAFSVKGFNVAVTGGNRGIGRGIVQAFAESGANVAVLSRNFGDAARTVEEISQLGGRNVAVQCDVLDMESVKSARDEVYSFFGHLDVLVNNAGVGGKKHFMETDGLEDWHRVINTNLHGPAYMIHEFCLPMCDAGRGGSVINVSSIGGLVIGNARKHPNAPYNAAKAGLHHFIHYMSVILGDRGIRINCIAPGPTHTDMDADLPPSMLENIESDMPMHRFGDPLEIGALAVFLASPAACHITGTVSVHDGGMMITGMR